MSRQFKCALLVSTCAFALSTSSAFTQTAECTPEEVAAGTEKCQSNNSSSPSGIEDLGTITVMGNRAPIDVMKYPGSVSVVDLGKKQEASTVIQALKSVPGFETGGDSGREAGQQYSIRGFGYQSEQRVIVKVDGIKRSPSLFSNHVSSFRTDPTVLRRAEVVKGGSSMLHGSGAIGGVVAMETKDAYDYLKDGRQYGVTLESRYESNNKKSGVISVAGAPDDLSMDFLLHGRLVEAGDITKPDGGANGYKKTENDSNTYNLFGKLGFDISEDQRLTLSAQGYIHDLTTVWQTLYHTSISDDTPVKGTLAQQDYVAHYSWDSSENDLINFDARFYYSNGFYDRSFASKSDPTYTLRYKNENKRWGGSLKNISEFQTGIFGHRVTAGVDYDKLKEDSLYVLRGVEDPLSMHPADSSDLGFYIQDEISMFDDRFTLTLGGRFDRFERQVEGQKKYSGDHFSPRVGAAFEVFDGITLLANYSETFRGPLVNEYASKGSLNPHYWYIPNASLKPELAKEFEVGFSVEKSGLLSDNDELRLKAMYFNGNIEDMIRIKRLGTTPIPGYGPLNPAYPRQEYAQYQNVDNAKRVGFEIGADYWINDWHFQGSFEHLDLYDKVTKEKVPQAYADKLRLAAAYTHTPWDLTLGAEVSHWFKPEQNPKSLVSRGTTYYRVRESFTQANIKAVWKPKDTGFKAFNDSFELTAGVNNLFDSKYINARDVETTSRVGTGRNFFFEMKKSF